jgi:hypothetical protein
MLLSKMSNTLTGMMFSINWITLLHVSFASQVIKFNMKQDSIFLCIAQRVKKKFLKKPKKFGV